MHTQWASIVALFLTGIEVAKFGHVQNKAQINAFPYMEPNPYSAITQEECTRRGFGDKGKD